MSAPQWARGMRQLKPGVYIDERENSIHMQADLYLQHLGVAVTRQNIENAQRGLALAIEEVCGKVPVIEVP